EAGGLELRRSSNCCGVELHSFRGGLRHWTLPLPADPLVIKLRNGPRAGSHPFQVWLFFFVVCTGCTFRLQRTAGAHCGVAWWFCRSTVPVTSGAGSVSHPPATRGWCGLVPGRG